MSLYNQLFGLNPYALSLMTALGCSSAPRFRDVYLDDEHLIILTRTGGPNRKDYAQENGLLQLLPGYLRDGDDKFDFTYACFYYAIPDVLEGLTAEIREKQGTRGMAAFRQLLDDMKNGKDTPAVRRALGVGASIFKRIEAIPATGTPVIIEV